MMWVMWLARPNVETPPPPQKWSATSTNQIPLLPPQQLLLLLLLKVLKMTNSPGATLLLSAHVMVR